MLLIRLAALAAAMSVLAWTTADPDLWGHVRFGLDILRDHAIAERDPYSFTSDRPWINHEWLAEVVMALSYGLDGSRGLVALKLLIVAMSLTLVLISLRHRAWDPIGHDLVVLVAIFGILGRVHPVRPQIFSVVLCAALLLVLSLVDRGSRRLLLLIPIIMALWANLHGGYLVGLGITGIWTLVRLYQQGDSAPRRDLLLALVAAIGATLANPYGIGLWGFLWETVGTTREGISDWEPLLRTSPIVIAQWVVTTAVAVLALRRMRVDPAYALIAGALGAATLRINRFDAFYALAVVMLLGPAFGRDRARTAAPMRRVPVPQLAIALLLVVGAGLPLLANRSSCIEIHSGPEPDATRYAATLRGRMVTFFDWGEYAIWQLSPEIQVSMDGRRETVYSERVVQAHLDIYTGSPDAIRLVMDMRPDWIWFPRHWPVISQLEGAGWHVAFRGPISVILSRQPAQVLEIKSVGSAARCFPDY